MMKLSGAQIIWEALTAEKVEVVFGYPGGAILPTYDAMTQYNIHHVLVRHEQGAAHMADGYARASGRVGVAIATSGPGATNLVTGIATAMMDSSPMVCITGQVPGPMIGKDAFQETDVTGITQPITKHNYLITSAKDIYRTIREAFYVARSGRPGPVLVDISKDAQNELVEFVRDDTPVRLPGYRPDLAALPESYERAAKLIAAAKKPVILAGQGIILSGATTEVLEFIHKTDMPAAMTLLGIGAIPAKHPHYLGMMGMHGEAWVNQAIQEADLLLSFGMRFDDRVTGTLDTYAPNARKIHIDIDPAEINKNIHVDVGLIGDLRMVLQKLLPMVEERKLSAWRETIEANKQAAGPRDLQKLPDDGILRAPHVIRRLCELTNKDTIIVTDVGQHQMWEAQYYTHENPRTLITSGGLGTMGFALPAAIGACFAKPKAEVWVIAGDGGFQMTACELSTCAQEGIRLNIAVVNNGFLGMVRQWQELFYEQRYTATPIRSPDFVKLTEAHGLKAVRVNSRDGIEAAVRNAQEEKGTVLIEFRVTEDDMVYPMVPAGAGLEEMMRRPEPKKADAPPSSSTQGGRV